MIPHFGLLPTLQPIVALVLYLGIIPVFLLSISWRPIVGLLYILPFFPLESIRFKMHEYPLGRSFVDIILLGVVIGLISRGQLRAVKNPFGLILLTIAVFTYLSLWESSVLHGLDWPFWIDNVRLSNWKNHVIVPMVVFVCTLACIRSPKDMKILIFTMCLSMTLLNRQLYGSAHQHTFQKYDTDQRAEAFENGLNSNQLGSLEAQFCLFCLGLRAFTKKRIVNLACLGMALLAGYCVMVSFSRGAYVAIVVGWLFISLVKDRVLGLILILFLFSWQAILPGAVKDRILMTYDKDSGELDDSAATRVSLWEDALDAFKHEPIFGTGYNSYTFLSRVGWRDTHNFYVKVIFELGVVGLSLFLYLFWKLYRTGYHLFRTAKDPFLASLGLGLAGWMVCAVIGNIFGDRWNFVQITAFMWTIVACVVRGQMMTDQAVEETPAETADVVCA